MRLKDKVAIITGGARGIGRAIALTFAREGADICLADIIEEQMREAVDEINALGRRAIACKTDVSSESDAAEMARLAESEFGRIDILVNSAGISGMSLYTSPVSIVNGVPFPVASVIGSDLSVVRRVLEVNLLGVFICSKAVLPAMLRRGSGNIINIASIAGKRGYPLMSAYAMSKAGVISFTQSLAGEVGRFGIRVNAVCPGWTDTDMTREAGPAIAAAMGLSSYEEMLEKLIFSQQKLPGLLTVDNIAPVALFLACNDSGAMTGQAINVSRGAEVH